MSLIAGIHLSNKRLIIAEFIILIFSAIISCVDKGNPNKLSSSDLLEVKLVLSYPSVTQENKFFIARDSQYMIYYQDFTLYRFPYKKTFTSNTANPNGKVESKITNMENRFQCFLYKKGGKFGYAFDSLNITDAKRYKIDSFLMDRLSIDENMISNSSDSLISKNPDKSEETYLRKKKINQWDADTIKLVYSHQFKNIDFSFSKIIDSVKGKKLIKVTLISKSNSKSEDYYFRQNREVIMELTSIPIVNPSIYSEIFKKYNKLDKN
ncbi:MAG: hypothetical protein ABIN01_13940 [Ferruginibacter sp.]